jgi:hypothetical protein
MWCSSAQVGRKCGVPARRSVENVVFQRATKINVVFQRATKINVVFQRAGRFEKLQNFYGVVAIFLPLSFSL